MEEGVIAEMMNLNGGVKAIPTIFINDELVIGYDQFRLKALLGIY
jgi:glutaredoxin